MTGIINKNGFKECAYENPKTNKFSRNEYDKPDKVINTLLRKNKTNHVYTSIYNYNNSDITNSQNITDADVIFDKLVFDFDIDETNEFLLLNNGFNSVDLKELSDDEIKKEADKIKENEQKELNKCKTVEDIQNFYLKKFENNYLIEPYKQCLKVAEYFVKQFGVEATIFFSGSKGTHMYLLLNNPITVKNVDELVYRIGSTFKNKLGFNTIDIKVCSSAKNRLIRLPCSQHQKTKLYNTQIKMSTTYDEMIMNSVIPQDINNVLIPDNDTTELENWLINLDNTITNELENKEIATEINNDDTYSLTSDIDIFNNADFEKNFLKVYKQGAMNKIGYSFTHLCYRSGIPKEKVTKFFEKLEISQNMKKVYSWINRTYKLDTEINRVGGLNNFLKEVSENATPTEHDAIIKYFKSIFKRKEKVECIELPEFKIGNFPKEYEANAQLIDGKYTEIQIKDIMMDEFNFVLNLKENKAYFTYDNIEYDFNYKYTSNGFKITNKSDFKELLSLIKDMFAIDLTKSFEFSLKTYFTKLYDKIHENNEDDRQTYIINAVRQQPTNTKLLIEFAEFLEQDLNIKKTSDGQCYFIQDNPKKYSNPTTDILTTRQLGYLLLTKYNLRLVEDNIATILKAIHGDENINTSRWEFGNNYYLETLPDFQVVKYTDPTVCSKKLGLEVDGKFRFFKYKPNVKLLNKWDEATLTEKTLRQILIPKTDLTDRNMYVDFLQRLGATFYENNIHKTITIYYEKSGNNGKSILSLLHKLIFNDEYIGFEPKELKQDIFASGRINNKHSIWMDELLSGSLDGVWDILKRFSSGLSNVNPRIMYSQSGDTDAKYGILFMNSNTIPKIPINDRSSLERTDILIPPNRFTTTPIEENEYLLDVFLSDKLKNDFSGLEWLVNASIKSYLSMSTHTFRCKQTWKETLSIIKETDELMNFLIDHTKIDYRKKTSNAEILVNFKNYCDENEINNTESDKILSKKIGSALDEIYSDELIRDEDDNRRKIYNIRILSKAEIERINNKKIIVDEMEYPEDYKFKSEIEKTIYNFIKGNKANTINDLKTEFPKQNINELLKHLKTKNLIHFEDII